MYVSCLGSDVVNLCAERLRLAEQQLLVFDDVVLDLVEYTQRNVLLLQDLADALDVWAPELVPYVREAVMLTLSDTFMELSLAAGRFCAAASASPALAPSPPPPSRRSREDVHAWDVFTPQELELVLFKETAGDPQKMRRYQTYIREYFNAGVCELQDCEMKDDMDGV